MTEFMSRGVAGIFRGPSIFSPSDRGGGLKFFHVWSGGLTFFFVTHFSKKCLKSHFACIFWSFWGFEAEVENL